jgi:hypothetical protein
MRRLLSLALVLYCSPLLAQTAARTISPGMTKAQVVAALGEPATVRSVGEDSYLFYPNACGKRCGMNDLVVLHADSVADAIFRSPDRHYTGKSSSPAAIPPKPTRMKPGPPSDTRPWIPVKPPVVKPAPSTKPDSTTKPAKNP